MVGPRGGATHTPEPSFAQLAARDLGRSVGGRSILQGLSFSVSSGDTLFVTGPSGVGKSLLLRSLAFLGAAGVGSWRG